jgi:SAM-dependent methyltransferase
MTTDDLKALESHFAFGKNWAKFAQTVSDEQIQQAVIGLKRLLQCESLAGRRFLEIGCGSGIHSLAAHRLDADEVVATDIDPDSISTSRTLLEKYAATKNWRVTACSVFDMTPAEVGQFDVVYSWGVLHHTGDLDKAVSIAAGLVARNGKLVMAIYRRTLLCPFWTIEKKWYRNASQRSQTCARRLYVFLYRVRSVIRRQSFARHIAEYKEKRGMNFYIDVHDWMGGYPYTSRSVAEMDSLMRGLGFRRINVDSLTTGFFAALGLFGSPCTEYVYTRAAAK